MIKTIYRYLKRVIGDVLPEPLQRTPSQTQPKNSSHKKKPSANDQRCAVGEKQEARWFRYFT